MLGHKGLGLQHQKYVDVEEKQGLECPAPTGGLWKVLPNLTACSRNLGRVLPTLVTILQMYLTFLRVSNTSERNFSKLLFALLVVQSLSPI